MPRKPIEGPAWSDMSRLDRVREGLGQYEGRDLTHALAGARTLTIRTSRESIIWRDDAAGVNGNGASRYVLTQRGDEVPQDWAPVAIIHPDDTSEHPDRFIVAMDGVRDMDGAIVAFLAKREGWPHPVWQVPGTSGNRYIIEAITSLDGVPRASLLAQEASKRAEDAFQARARS